MGCNKGKETWREGVIKTGAFLDSLRRKVITGNTNGLYLTRCAKDEDV